MAKKKTSRVPKATEEKKDDEYTRQQVINIAMPIVLIKAIDEFGDYLSKKQFRHYSRAEVVRHLAQYGIRRWKLQLDKPGEDPSLDP